MGCGAEAFGDPVPLEMALDYFAGGFLAVSGEHTEVARKNFYSPAATRSRGRAGICALAGLHCYSSHTRLRAFGPRAGPANAPGNSWSSKLQRLASDRG